MDALMPRMLEEILKELRAELEVLLGDLFDSVYLYGSQARGDARADSDIDVLIILRRDFNYFDMIEKTSHVTTRLSLEHTVVISSTFTTREAYETLQTPFLANVRREGILI